MPTKKQNAVIPVIVANRGSITGQELMAAGYSKAQAKNPKQVLKAKGIQYELRKALKKNKVTIDRAITPISDALDAYKQDQYTGEIRPDLALRLRAATIALNLLGVKQLNDNDKSVKVTVKDVMDINNAIKSNNEVELQRVIFSKKSETK